MLKSASCVLFEIETNQERNNMFRFLLQKKLGRRILILKYTFAMPIFFEEFRDGLRLSDKHFDTKIVFVF